jgi:hypothetical protein
MRQRARIVFCIRNPLGDRHMAGRLDEFLELPVRDRRSVDEEAVDLHLVGGRFFLVVGVGTHPESPAGHEYHAGRASRRDLGRAGFGDVHVTAPDR